MILTFLILIEYISLETPSTARLRATDTVRGTGGRGDANVGAIQDVARRALGAGGELGRVTDLATCRTGGAAG